MDIETMSNQERIQAFGSEQASKYHGPYKRRNELKIYPSLAPQGAQWHEQMDWAKRAGLPEPEPMQRDYIYRAQSFKKNRPEKVEAPKTFSKSDIKYTKRSKKRSNG